MTGPRVSSGPDSKQDYGTPADFLDVVARRFGPITFDLAAHADNHKCARYFAPAEFVETTGKGKSKIVTRTPNIDPGAVALDSLAQDWSQLGGLLWLNPPFADIAPWALNCALESMSGAEILLLVPAAVGSNWFRDHVAPHATVYLLNGRMSFDGTGLYPKDCILAHFKGERPGIKIWNWKRDAILSDWAYVDRPLDNWTPDPKAVQR